MPSDFGKVRRYSVFQTRPTGDDHQNFNELCSCASQSSLRNGFLCCTGTKAFIWLLISDIKHSMDRTRLVSHAISFRVLTGAEARSIFVYYVLLGISLNRATAQLNDTDVSAKGVYFSVCEKLRRRRSKDRMKNVAIEFTSTWIGIRRVLRIRRMFNRLYRSRGRT